MAECGVSSSLYDLGGNKIDETYQRVVQTVDWDGGAVLHNGTGSQLESPIKNISGSYAVSTFDEIIGVDTSVNPVTITFPSANAGKYQYVVKDEGFNSSAKPITFVSQDSNDRWENGETEVKIRTNGISLTVYSNGQNNYYII